MHNESKKGFTLIELLIVVVIIGILAAIAIPKFAQTREKAYISSMKSDLRNIATEQEIFYSDQDPPTYSTTVAGIPYVTSTGVEIEDESGNATGWSAHLSHPGATVDCAVFYGTVAGPVGPAVDPGVVTCG